MTHWIQTFTGKQFNIENPDKEMIDIKDIARALALTNRYNGHTFAPYSVAQHCCEVSQFLLTKVKCNPRVSWFGLMHDAAEAYIGDNTSPLKEMVPELKTIEHAIQWAIWEHFNSIPTGEELNIVKKVDYNIMINERQAIMGPCLWPWEVDRFQPLPQCKIVPKPWQVAEETFLRYHEYLMKRMQYEKDQEKEKALNHLRL